MVLINGFVDPKQLFVVCTRILFIANIGLRLLIHKITIKPQPNVYILNKGVCYILYITLISE